jgi:hypothetical protein
MIEVFETWFNQFTRAEQIKLMKHIRKNHFDLIEGFTSKPSSRIDKRLLETSIGAKSQSEFAVSSVK